MDRSLSWTDLVAGLFLCIERRANANCISTDTGRIDLRNVSATVNLLWTAFTRCATECFQCQLQAAHLYAATQTQCKAVGLLTAIRRGTKIPQYFLFDSSLSYFRPTNVVRVGFGSISVFLFLSPHADRPAGDIHVYRLLLFLCPQFL